jgi:amino acid transporter
VAQSTVPVASGGGAAPMGKGLKVGAIGLVSAVVIGVASTAPGYSLAAGLGLIAGPVGAQTPSIMWVAFIPMLFIAASYYYLNRTDPDCGTSFTWVTRAMGPKSGWLTGWGIIIADLVIMPSLAYITGRYVFLLFDVDEGIAGNRYWIMLLGVAFILLMTFICVIGIELNARSQFFLLSAEVLVLGVFSVVALYKVAAGDLGHGSVSPSLSWLNPFEISSTSALVSGVLVAVFLYWGWDTAVTVNEETKDATRTPGRAAVISTVVLIATYLVVAFAAQAVRGPGFLAAHSDDVLSATGNLVLGSPFDKFLIIAVLSSAAASTQTTILPAARSQLSMAVHRGAPSWFGQINPKFLSPANATWAFGIFSAVWYMGLTFVSENVLFDSIAAVGLMIAFYYGMTGFACVIYYRKHLFKSLKNFAFVGVAPLLGGVSLTYIFVKSCIDLSKPENSTGGDSWFGVGPPLVIGLGLLLIGVPLMLGWWAKAPAFFRRGRDPHPHPEPDGTGAAVPPILDAGPIRDADLDAVKPNADAAVRSTPGGDDGR